jgi:hypothetical protein
LSSASSTVEIAVVGEWLGCGVAILGKVLMPTTSSAPLLHTHLFAVVGEEEVDDGIGG